MLFSKLKDNRQRNKYSKLEIKIKIYKYIKINLLCNLKYKKKKLNIIKNVFCNLFKLRKSK